MLGKNQAETQMSTIPVFDENMLAPAAGKPIVRITVEGGVGSGKTAILSLIMEALEDQIEIVVANEYTLNELKLEEGNDHIKTLKMYSPTIVLAEKISTSA